MRSSKKHTPQLGLFHGLSDQLDQKHPLYQLAITINCTKDQRTKHGKRAAIEPMIGHLKQDDRLCGNYLKGILGDNMNIILAVAAMNFKRRINL